MAIIYHTYAAVIANDLVKQHHSKAMDMHFYWVCDCFAKGNFVLTILLITSPKHHSPAHHRLMRSRYLVDLHRPDFANASTRLTRGCVDDFPTSTASTPSGHHPGYEAPSLVSSTNSFDTIDSNPVLLYTLLDYSSSNPVLPYPLPDYYNQQFTSSVTKLTI